MRWRDIAAGTAIASAAAACARNAPVRASVDEGERRAPDNGARAGGVCADPDPASLARFHGVLGPFGAWIDDPTWGRVWVPHEHLVGADFRPYGTDGRWARTTAGEWIWLSELRFMDAAFHFGRWAPIDGGRWGWIAGSCYADAWVAWRTADVGPGYVGWTPVWPAWVWRDGRAVTAPAASADEVEWVDCPVERIFHLPEQACASSPQEQALLRRTARPYRRALRAFEAARVPPDATPRGPLLPEKKAPVVEVRARRAPAAPIVVVPGTNVDARDVALAETRGQPPLDGYPAWRPFPRATITLSTGGQPAFYGLPPAWAHAPPAYAAPYPSWNAPYPSGAPHASPSRSWYGLPYAYGHRYGWSAPYFAPRADAPAPPAMYGNPVGPGGEISVAADDPEPAVRRGRP